MSEIKNTEYIFCITEYTKYEGSVLEIVTTDIKKAISFLLKLPQYDRTYITSIWQDDIKKGEDLSNSYDVYNVEMYHRLLVIQTNDQMIRRFESMVVNNFPYLIDLQELLITTFKLQVVETFPLG